MTDRAPDAATLDELEEDMARADLLGSNAGAPFDAISVAPPTLAALVAAARREAELRQALTDLLAVERGQHTWYACARCETDHCLTCGPSSDWPCPVERARLLVTGDPS